MSKRTLQVKFLKGVGELDGPYGGHSYVHRTADGDAFLKAADSPERSTRYHFHRGDVSGHFTSDRVRQKYMATINRAAGETVVVAAEAA